MNGWLCEVLGWCCHEASRAGTAAPEMHGPSLVSAVVLVVGVLAMRRGR